MNEKKAQLRRHHNDLRNNLSLLINRHPDILTQVFPDMTGTVASLGAIKPTVLQDRSINRAEEVVEELSRAFELCQQIQAIFIRLGVYHEEKETSHEKV